MKDNKIILVYILGAHPTLPVNILFNLEDYKDLKEAWGFN